MRPAMSLSKSDVLRTLNSHQAFAAPVSCCMYPQSSGLRCSNMSAAFRNVFRLFSVFVLDQSRNAVWAASTAASASGINTPDTSAMASSVAGLVVWNRRCVRTSLPAIRRGTRGRVDTGGMAKLCVVGLSDHLEACTAASLKYYSWERVQRRLEGRLTLSGGIAVN